MTTEQKSEQKDMPEWWDTFCEAVKTRTLDQYECKPNSWDTEENFVNPSMYFSGIYEKPNEFKFRKKQRTVRIEINGKLVELVAPVLAGDVIPQDTSVFALAVGSFGRASLFDAGAIVFTSSSDFDAICAALMRVKP